MKPAPKHRKSMQKLQKNVDILKLCLSVKAGRNFGLLALESLCRFI